MGFGRRSPRRAARPRPSLVVALLLVLTGLVPATTDGAATVTRIGLDPYTFSASQHATQVEPDSYAWGSTIVAAAQTGRFTNGGSTNVCWSTSKDAGLTWARGCLPGVSRSDGSGSYDRVSDPSVAYDPKHGRWLISTLGLTGTSSVLGAAVLTSYSTDGTTWGPPVTVAAVSGYQDFDKNWVVCDTSSGSAYYGNCYTEWDDHGSGNLILMSTSSDGATWGPAKATANNASGIGGQPVVRPNGTVVVPIDDGNEGALLSFRSTDGGATWSATTQITTISSHTAAGSLRSGPLPTADVDASGTVYVVWADCRFRSRCAVNDLVFVTSTDGTSWSAVRQIPLETSAYDHMIPGVAVERGTGGSTARIALSYHYYSNPKCGKTSPCTMGVAFVSSSDGGARWSAPTVVRSPYLVSYLPNTTLGRMAGDYISTSIAGGRAFPFFVDASAGSGSGATAFNVALATVPGGLPLSVAPAAAANLATAVVRAGPTASGRSILSRR